MCIYLFVDIAAMYGMQINVEKDKQTGETKVLSTAALGPEGVYQRGVKVYDDGSKVVYEVHSGGAVVENGVQHLTSSEVDQLLNRAGRTNVSCDRYVSDSLTTSESNASTEGPRSEAPEASADHPVTMIFMGYQNVEGEAEASKLLGYEGAIQAELVLIDEDDEKSLREKTVTDVSTLDGNAAELVAGISMTEATDTPSGDGLEATESGTEPAAGTEKKKRCKCCTIM
uniref:Palm2 and akap2 fusion n=1 Tax=Callorhinchus milii TaxID=7868 RepID=A0A4W3JP78_CALMI